MDQVNQKSHQKQTRHPQSQTRILVLTTLAGILFINLFVTLQFLYVLRLPLSIPVYIAFSVVGAAIGFVIGAIYYQWRRYARELRQNEQRLRAVLQHMPVMLDAYDLDGEVVFWNGECERITGYRAEEVIGQANVVEMLYPNKTQQPLLDKDYRNQASKIRCRDGSIKTILWSNLSQEFPISGWASWRIGVDISEQKRVEDALREAERDYRSLFEHIPDGIYRSTIDGRQLRANPALVELNGYTNEAEMLQAVHDIAREWYVDPARRDTFKRLIEQNGLVRNFESEIYRHNTRERIWISESAYVVRDESGTPLYYEGTVKDITEQKQAEEIVRTTAQIRLIADHLPVWIAYLDNELRYRFVNQHYQTILDASLPQTLGQHIRDALGEPAYQTIEPYIEKVLAGEQATFESTFAVHDHSLDVNIMLVPHVVQDKTVGFFFLMVDIAQQRQETGAAYHLQKMESLAMLAGGVANDFNNLLLVILGHISMIQGLLPPTSQNALAHLEQAANATERAADLTRQMLTYAGRGHLITESTSLNNLIETTTTAVSFPINVKLITQLYPALAQVHIDANQMGQVITALIHNGIEALDKTLGTITITTGQEKVTSRDSHFWQYTAQPLAPGVYASLEVRDSGPGMDSETLVKIFDPFFTTKVVGQGLGLASVLGIIRGHKGGMMVQSALNEGSVFKILLPLATQPVVTSAPRVQTERAPIGGTAVLVIDDDDAVRAAIVGMIKPQNIDVFSASGGQPGVELYRQHQDKIGLVVLDIVMPKMDGEQTHHALRQVNPNIPIILSSGYDERSAAKRLVDNVTTGFLQKPYRAPALIKAIRRYLREAASTH
ncbi:MAG: PAS domain S-box protein [Chloroflexota bacterium]